jgi:hypothetical protein
VANLQTSVEGTVAEGMERKRTGVVVTSIAAPNTALRNIAAGCQRGGHLFWVIGDLSSPADFALDGCHFVGVEEQLRTEFRLAALCPTRHYARKNVGYLLAMQAGARILIETDDDNLPLPGFWEPRPALQIRPVIENSGWVNVYRYFTPAHIWPRGLPLDAIQTPPPPLESLRVTQAYCPIQQGLAGGNPDVDAVYRLAMPPSGDFQFDGGSAVVLSAGSWCPFNSQNTRWYPEAFPLLYLPAYCPFRMTDIWRSLIAQRICWENGWGVLFHETTVFQERNDHNLMRDFADEVPGYLHNRRIAETLADLRLTQGPAAIPDNMLRCYEALIGLDVLKAAEMPLLEAWIDDLAMLGCLV